MRTGRYLAALAAAGVLAAGCGTQVAGAPSLAAAVSRTAGQTARIAVTTSMRMQGMSVSFTGTGVFDFAHSRGTLRMGSPVGMTEVFLPPETYLRFSGGSGMPLPHGKTWVAVDAKAPGGPLGPMLGPFGGSSTDPADLLASLTAISSGETKLGTATIRGARVTGYRVDIDPAKAAARVPAAERAGFRAFARTLGSGAIPVDVWVDGQGLVRRVTVSLHLPGGTGAPAGARMAQTTDFYGFGVPVRVSAPPAAKVASMAEMLGSAQAGGPGGGGPPPVSGTLAPAQAAAAEQAAGTFWAALGSNDPKAAARAVVPAERSCVRSLLSGGAPKVKVTSFRAVSAQPAGNGRATVRFTVALRVSIGGRNVPVPPPGHVQWLVTAETAGHWYVDLARGSAFMFSGACP